MKIIDLSHTISPGMPVYPGTEPPTFVPACSLEDLGFVEKKITLYSHTGTHMDAPAHILDGPKTLDQLPADYFMGKSAVLDVTGTEDPLIERPIIEPYGAVLEEIHCVLLRTGWSSHWGTESYYQGYPVLSFEAARWIADFGLKGLGVAAISLDGVGSTAFPVHATLFEHDMVVIENLTNLESLPSAGFMLSCFPLKIEDADGSPIRAVAIIE